MKWRELWPDLGRSVNAISFGPEEAERWMRAHGRVLAFADSPGPITHLACLFQASNETLGFVFFSVPERADVAYPADMQRHEDAMRMRTTRWRSAEEAKLYFRQSGFGTRPPMELADLLHQFKNLAIEVLVAASPSPTMVGRKKRLMPT